MDLYIAGFWLLLAILTVLAIACGDRGSSTRTIWADPERSVAISYWAAALLTVVLRPSVATRFFDLEHALIVVDFGLAAGLASIGVRSGKGWVLCAAALQLISATAHVARMFTPRMWRLGYQVMEEASSYPALLLLAWGIWSRCRSQRRGRRSRT